MSKKKLLSISLEYTKLWRNRIKNNKLTDGSNTIASNVLEMGFIWVYQGGSAIPNKNVINAELIKKFYNYI